ncbi:MAG: histidine phosphatase family protein [Granulosicoccus sp.]
MKLIYSNTLSKLVMSAVLVTVSTASGSLLADNGHNSNRVTLYFTRHAEKQTVLKETAEDSGIYTDNCNSSRSRCEEELNPLGSRRAELLAEWLEQRGIAPTVTHVVSSDKQRTRQTVQPLADLIQSGYGDVLPDGDAMPDGVWQVPFAGDTANEVNGNSGSVDPTVMFIQTELQAGDVAVIAAHSGTIYKILGGALTDGTGGLGIDTTQAADSDDFPKNPDDGKVPGFGDVWKVVIRSSGDAVLKWRRDVDFKRLQVID